MALFEILAINVGTAISKSILKVWLKDTSVMPDAAASIVDIIQTKTNDALTQRRASRRFEDIADKVAESLLPLFESVEIDDGGREAVAILVGETLKAANITAVTLLEASLDPNELAVALLKNERQGCQYLSEAERLLYRRAISESCQYIVDIGSQLPSFTERSIAEVLKRDDQILDVVTNVLSEVRRIRDDSQRGHPATASAQFEEEYRRAVARRLDEIELFGADLDASSRRHRLSVAYITLSAESESRSSKESALDAPIIDTETTLSEDDRSIVSIDELLANSNKLLIRGLAGSGKTTLLQWIAVKAAKRDFMGPLLDWNHTIPFYIRLRQFVDSELPAPEIFPSLISNAISDKMPKGWVHEQLRLGRAIILIDGLDEVSQKKREDVHRWLVDLVDISDACRFVITSRPYAIAPDWMKRDGFSDTELQPMDVPEIFAFIDHWHEAVKEELNNTDDTAELEPLPDLLKDRIRRDGKLRELATSPLLCAMLCALHRERRRRLPMDRIELYEACCKLLIERRDRERGINLREYPDLTSRAKIVLLQNMAYWLIKNGWSEVTVDDADAHFNLKLQNMQVFSSMVNGKSVRRLFVERTGMIREPVVGSLDFTHRTFQEFLAAQAAIDEGDIGVLINNADDEQWREVVVLAAGLGKGKVPSVLVRGLIERGDNEAEHRHQLHLLAVACLETAIELDEGVRRDVQKRLRLLVPPRNMTDAKALASAGDEAVRYLHRQPSYSAVAAAACVRSLSLIGGDRALEVIEKFYAQDKRQAVYNELLRGWDYFDRAEYGARVLSVAFRERKVKLHRTALLPAIAQYVTNIQSLRVERCFDIFTLDIIASLKNLMHLSMVSLINLRSIDALVELRGLTTLDLWSTRNVSDFSALAALNQLERLSLFDSRSLKSLQPLSGLQGLVYLDLEACSEVVDLSPLSSMQHLSSLDLRKCKSVSDLSPLADLKRLFTIDLSGCDNITDLSPLLGLERLRLLWLPARYESKGMMFENRVKINYRD